MPQGGSAWLLELMLQQRLAGSHAAWWTFAEEGRQLCRGWVEEGGLGLQRKGVVLATLIAHLSIPHVVACCAVL